MGKSKRIPLKTIKEIHPYLGKVGKEKQNGKLKVRLKFGPFLLWEKVLWGDRALIKILRWWVAQTFAGWGSFVRVMDGTLC